MSPTWQCPQPITRSRGRGQLFVPNTRHSLCDKNQQAALQHSSQTTGQHQPQENSGTQQALTAASRSLVPLLHADMPPAASLRLGAALVFSGPCLSASSSFRILTADHLGSSSPFGVGGVSEREGQGKITSSKQLCHTYFRRV